MFLSSTFKTKVGVRDGDRVSFTLYIFINRMVQKVKEDRDGVDLGGHTNS